MEQCTIFVKPPKLPSTEERLAEQIATICAAGLDGRHVVSGLIAVTVCQNDDRTPGAFSLDLDGFMNAPYLLEVGPGVGATRETYVKAVAELLEGLWMWGAAAVAAADFEDELPRRGGLAGA